VSLSSWRTGRRSGADGGRRRHCASSRWSGPLWRSPIGLRGSGVVGCGPGPCVGTGPPGRRVRELARRGMGIVLGQRDLLKREWEPDAQPTRRRRVVERYGDREDLGCLEPTVRAARGLLALDLVRDSVLVLSDLDGTQRHPERFSRRFAGQALQARRTLGEERLPVIRLHDQRHTAPPCCWPMACRWRSSRSAWATRAPRSRSPPTSMSTPAWGGKRPTGSRRC
jgi:hypothetical protein